MPLPHIDKYNVKGAGVTVDTATKKAAKSGVYRAKNGHAIYLNEGDPISAQVAANYTYDGEASKHYATEPEHGYVGTVQDAPQHAEARSAGPAPQNRKEGSLENRSDAEMAADAAKGKQG